MDESLKKYWQTYSEYYSNEMMIHKYFNPLREFEEEFIEGAFLELGCGQSNFLVEYSRTGREIYAIDNDDFQLSQLNERIEIYAGENKGRINLLNLTIPKDNIPKALYSVVILSNFLHFFSIRDCVNIISQIITNTATGSLIYVRVHSQLHSYNKPAEENNNAYFKHFFLEEDLQSLFNEKYFERIIISNNIQFKKSKFDTEMEKNWIDKILDSKSIFDTNKREEILKQNIKDEKIASITCIYRRK